MEGNAENTNVEQQFDKIDVKREHKELIDIRYRLELLYFVKVLLYHSYEKDGLN